MSEDTGAVEGGEVTAPEAPGVPEENSGGHPAWQPVYDDIFEIMPGALHGPVRERLEKHFGEMDRSANDRFQKVHSEYEPYKPFRDAQIDPEHLTAAWQFFSAAQNDPQAVWENMGNTLGFFEQGQGNEEEQTEEFGEEGQQNYDITQDPAFLQTAQAQEMIVEFLATQQQAKEEAESDKWLDGQLSSLREKHNLDDEDLEDIMSRVAVAYKKNPNQNPEQALQVATERFVSRRDGFRTQPRPGQLAPRVMPSGGGVPASVNAADLSDADRRDLAIQMVQRFQQSNNGG